MWLIVIFVHINDNFIDEYISIPPILPFLCYTASLHQLIFPLSEVLYSSALILSHLYLIGQILWDLIYSDNLRIELNWIELL